MNPHGQSNNFHNNSGPRFMPGIRTHFSHKPFLPGGQIIPEPRPLITPPFQQQIEQDAFKLQLVQQEQELINTSDNVKLEDIAMDEDEKPKEKRITNNWVKKQRINKLLNKVKPKSSMAILNEICKDVSYEVIPITGGAFKATVNVNGDLFNGDGRSKSLAQTAAAEEALKHMVLSSPKETIGDAAVGHSHLLSYALYKLLNSWDMSGNMVTKMQQASSLKSNVVVNPTKKFPANPEKIHPVMLLSQTHPTAEFKEIASTVSPNTSFTIQVTVNNQHFTGTATKKRDAKKDAAKKACMEVLGIKYED